MQYTNFEQLPLVISVEELAKILGIGRNSAYELVKSDQIYTVRCGRQIRIPKEALKRYLNQ